ncbi:MAG: MBL fold metallo-hydrolase [Solirubrobacteraceae bacterium]|nr:MBL fold metallo-hydrolase [Patulibacter sp.]
MPQRTSRALAAHPEDPAPLPAGIHRIALPTPFPIGRVNLYLLEGEPLTLVDAGCNTGTSLEALSGALRELGYALEDIELLLLTHEHVDHIGLTEIIAARSGCRVAAFSPLQIRFDPEGAPGDAVLARIMWGTAQLERHGYPHELAVGAQAVMYLGQALSSRPDITDPLAEGDVIRAGGRDLEVLHRPGHSLSDLVYVDRADGVAFSGDHVLAATSPNPTLSPPLDVPRPDETTERVRSLPLLIDSIRKTAEDGLSLMLSGHGPAVGPPAELIAKRLTFHERRATKIEAMLSDEPQTIYELACRMWRGVPILQPHLTHSELIGHVDLLTGDGRASEVPMDDGVVGFVRG